MTPKEAIAKAKSYVIELYEDEPIVHVGLEEISFDESSDAWHVTVGFERMWSRTNTQKLVAAMAGDQIGDRIYKVVSIANDNGELRSITNRQLGA